MAPGSWQKWYDGKWSEPGVGGRESNMVPVDGTSGTGYTPASKEYNPANTGTTTEQVAAGKTPPTSPLFVMDVAYNAYLGLYIGEPQAVDQSGKAPQQFYVTDNLATQKWRLAGDTGTRTDASWYRWFLDGVSKTSSSIVGKNFRSYCAFGCPGDASGTYFDLTVEGPHPAAPLFDQSRAYRIASGDGRVLGQVPGRSATTSQFARAGATAWSFKANGDGSYRIVNRAGGGLLGVGTSSPASRAGGTAPTVTPAGSGGPSVGQQWFVLRSGNGYRLVNRYSGLVLGLSGRAAETTPARYWTDRTGSPVGGGRTASQQTLVITAVS